MIKKLIIVKKQEKERRIQMKRAIIIIVLLEILFLGLLTNCTQGNKERSSFLITKENGIKVYKNKNEGSLKDLVILPREILKIESFDDTIKNKSRELFWPRYLDIDNQNNIFIMDVTAGSVKKFDKTGKFIKSFVKKGSGPGEVQRPYLLAIIDNTIFIPDPNVRQMVTFDNNGIFKEKFLLRGIPNFMKSFNNKSFIGFMNMQQRDTFGLHNFFNLVLMDKHCEEKAVLRKHRRLLKPGHNDLLDRFTAYASSKKRIFVSDNSEDAYRINVFDKTGKLVSRIEKEYQKIKFNKNELNALNNGLRKLYKKYGSTGYNLVKNKYKKAINYLHWDKHGRLLVVPSIERNELNKFDYLVDVFKEGVFLKRTKLDVFKGYDFLRIHEEKIFFKGDRIYQIDEANAIIKVFEY